MPTADPLQSLSDEQRAFLERYNLEPHVFRGLRDAYLRGDLSEASNRIAGRIEPPSGDDIKQAPTGEERERLEALGRRAIEAGEVGHVVLNGGMATRFGGVVKGTVEVSDGISFLGLKLLDASRCDGDVPLILMNSFATEEKTREHLEEHDYFGLDPDDVWEFVQNISVRLTPQGEVFLEDGEPSFYGPGHGDLASAINRGTLQRFRDHGGKYLFMSNVDNVLATIDPVILGQHIDADVQMTVEAAPRYEGDRGGMPARVNGRLQVVEAFRFPVDFDDSDIPVFNTNTFLFDADALARDFDLTWFVVEKEVDGTPVVQFERLAGELSAFLDTQFVEIPREGDSSRFLPIKRPEDLEEARGYLRRVMKERQILE